MDKTNSNSLVQSIERSLHLIHKKRFSIHCSCCFRTPLVELLGLCPHSCYTSLNFGLEMTAFGVAFRQLKSFSTMSRRGEHKLCTYGAGMAKCRWAGTPSYAKTTDLSGSVFSSPVPEEKKPTQYSLLQQLPRKTFDR